MSHWLSKLFPKQLIVLLLLVVIVFLLAFFFEQRTKAQPIAPPHISIQKPTPTGTFVSQTDATAFYILWKQSYIVTDVATKTLRVTRPDTYNDTVSSGIATGMLAAVSMRDKQTFDGLWSYAKQHMNDHGLMIWHINANGKNLDTMSASDADEDMAYALVAADSIWGGYKHDAQSLLDNIQANDIEQNTYILKPGDSWGGSDVLSPSYFSPAYYDIFARYTGDYSWTKVKTANRQVIANILNSTPAEKTGLIPDWTTALGTEVTVYNDKPYTFGYKSINAAWRFSLASNWENDIQSKQELKTLSQFFKTTGTDAIVDGYSIDGVDMGGRHYQAFIDAAVTASQYNQDAAYAKQIINSLKTSLLQNSYYADTYRLITLLVLSNQFPHVK